MTKLNFQQPLLQLLHDTSEIIPIILIWSSNTFRTINSEWYISSGFFKEKPIKKKLEIFCNIILNNKMSFLIVCVCIYIYIYTHTNIYTEKNYNIL